MPLERKWLLFECSISFFSLVLEFFFLLEQITRENFETLETLLFKELEVTLNMEGEFGIGRPCPTLWSRRPSPELQKLTTKG